MCLAQACPDSAREIINSASKVRMRLSDSSIVRSSARGRSASVSDFARSASSARLRSRVSGVFRSCAILSETCLRPPIRFSMRPSMALRLFASRSNSSPEPVTARRPPKSPRMICSEVAVIESIRFITRRVTKTPPPIPSTTTTTTDQCAAVTTICRTAARRSSMSRPTSTRKPPDAGDAHQRTVVVLLCFVDPPIGNLRPALAAHHAGRQRADIAGDALPRRRGHEIEIGARPQRAILDRDHQPAHPAPRFQCR